MHDSADHTLRFAPNRNDEAAVPHRHGHVGDSLVRLELGHGALEKLDQLSLRALQLAPDFPERRRRVIANLAVLVDRALDRILDGLVGDKRIDLPGENSRHHRRRAFSAQRFACDARAAEKLRQDQKLARTERCMFDTQARQRRPRIRHAVQVPRLLGGYERADRRHARVLALDRIAIGDGPQLPHPLGAERRRGSLGNEGESARKFNDVEGVRIHAATPILCVLCSS